MLEVEDIMVRVGARLVVDGATLAVAPGEIVSVIGPNGAGKTTLGRAIAGFLRPAGGRVTLRHGERIVVLERKRPAERCRLGIVYLAADRPVFHGLTTRENLLLVEAALGSTAGQPDRTDSAVPVASDVFLRAVQSAETLSGGEQRLLALARAEVIVAAARAKGTAPAGYLILDEPSRGLAPRAVDAMAARLHGLADAGVGILLLEQDAPLPMRLAARMLQMSLGRLRAGDAGRVGSP